jgi:hypothetical protein
MIKQLLIATLMLACAIAKGAVVLVDIPLMDVRIQLAATLVENGMELVNNSDDHPAFEQSSGSFADGTKVFDVYRFKLTAVGPDKQSTRVEVAYEQWAEITPGSYPKTMQEATPRSMREFESKATEALVVKMFETDDPDEPKHDKPVMVGI